MSLPARVGAFLGELKRRKVYQVAVVYIVVAAGALQLADALVPSTSLPEWSQAFFVVLAIVGLPAVLVLAWLFDLTPEGVRRSGGGVEAPAIEAPAGEPFAGEASTGEPFAGEASTGETRRANVSARDGTPVPGASGVPPADPSEATPGPALDPRTIAVLPFANLSAAEDAEPFVAGLHDDLLTELSRASALTVISRTSVRRYRDTDRSMVEIGRELGAGTIVEAGVQKAGDRVRLNVQLIDARSDVHLWAERYDRRLTAENIFELQTELASQIMGALQARLTGAEEAAHVEQPTGDLEAYRQYSIGRALFVDRTVEALLPAIEHFERAVDRDPGYALAWSGLSLALINMVDYGHSDAPEYLERGLDAAHRALELAPELAEAHSALGAYYSAVHESRKSLESHTRAATLRPGFAGAHQWRCWASLLLGDPETAVEAGSRAARLDPLDPEARGNLALAHLGCGSDEEALWIARAAMDDHPGFDYTRWVAALALYHLGRAGEARETLEGMSETWSRAWPETARGLARAAARDEAGVRVSLAHQVEAGAAFHAGLLHAALGEPEPAFEEIAGALPLPWDEALYLRYFREAPMRFVRESPDWVGLLRELDRAWGAGAGE